MNTEHNRPSSKSPAAQNFASRRQWPTLPLAPSTTPSTKKSEQMLTGGSASQQNLQALGNESLSPVQQQLSSGYPGQPGKPDLEGLLFPINSSCRPHWGHSSSRMQVASGGRVSQQKLQAFGYEGLSPVQQQSSGCPGQPGKSDRVGLLFSINSSCRPQRGNSTSRGRCWLGWRERWP